MDMTRRRIKHLDEVEDFLRLLQRELPIGLGQSPEFVAGLDHLDPHLRHGSRDYVEVVAAMRQTGLL